MTGTTIRNIAGELGISPSTVSRALNGRPGLSHELRRRVLDLASETKYRPSGIARALQSSRTRTLGLVVPSILNPFFTDVAHAAEVAARAHGYSLVIGNADEDEALERDYLQLMAEQRVAGLLLTPSRDDGEAVADLVGHDLPVVLLDRAIAGSTAPHLLVEASEAIRHLARHLLASGYRRIGLIRGPARVSVADDRVNLFHAELERAGGRVASVVDGAFTVAGGRRAFEEMMRGDPPEVVFSTNNQMTEGVLLSALDSGIAIGRDVGLASFDDVPLFRLHRPAITAIAQPTASMGRLALEMLMRRIAGEAVPAMHVQAELILRQSCNGPGGAALA